jgi:hypothetical protein
MTLIEAAAIVGALKNGLDILKQAWAALPKDSEEKPAIEAKIKELEIQLAAAEGAVAIGQNAFAESGGVAIGSNAYAGKDSVSIGSNAGGGARRTRTQED